MTNEVAQHATVAYSRIIELKESIVINFLELGGLFKLVRDESLYKSLDCDTFNEFIAQPEIGFQRSTVYMYIQLFEKYNCELNLNPEQVKLIGVRGLRTILPVVDNDPEEWLNKAETLGPKDLINEVRVSQGRGEMKEKKKTAQAVEAADSYVKMVEAAPCCVCGATPVDKAHFPRSRGAGAGDARVIPLCRECHREQHDTGRDMFMINYRDKIFDWFYGVIEVLMKQGNND